MPTHDRRETLSPIVDALLADPATTELVIVDDGSSDGTIELLRAIASRDARLRPIVIANAGQAAARDVGVGAASHPVVLLIDDDVLAAPGLVSGHAAHHAAQARLVVVGAMPVPERLQREGGGPVRLYASWYEQQTRTYLEQPEAVLRSLWAGNVSLPRADALRIGVANPVFDARYNEDRDFGLRLLKGGLTGRYDPVLRAEHLYRRPIEAFLRDARATGEGNWLVHELHADLLGALAPDEFTRHLSPVMAAAVRLSSRPRAAGAQDAALRLARVARAVRAAPVERRALTAAFRMAGQRAALERSRGRS